MSKVIKFIKRKKLLVGGGAFVLLIIIIIAIALGSNSALETASPVSSDLIRTVKISGKVVPEDSVELAFELSGIISSVTKATGQLTRRGEALARISSNGISAQILQAEAELALAEANLNKLEGGGLYQAQIENSKRTLIQTIIEAYSASDNAIYNQTDPILLNPRTSRPELVFSLSSYSSLRDAISSGRVSLGTILDEWKTMVNTLNTTNYAEEDLTQSKGYLAAASTYIADIARATSLAEASGSLSQTTLDGYKSSAASARDSLNQISQDLISAEDKFRGLLLEVPVQVARVESARASLANYRSQLSKTVLISPINGVISKQDAKVGQVVSPTDHIISIISQALELETFVPEVLISGIAIGNKAEVTLDAYNGQKIFQGVVSHIDPAETLRDGVSSYKVKLTLNDPEKLSKSGMSADITIETFRKSGVRLIPERAVLREGNETFILISTKEEAGEKTQINIGERDSSGNVELLTDLPDDTQIIINPEG